MEQLIVPKTQSCFFFQVTISSRTRYYECLNDKIVSRQKTDVQIQYQLGVPQRPMQGGALRTTVRVVSRHLYHVSVSEMSVIDPFTQMQVVVAGLLPQTTQFPWKAGIAACDDVLVSFSILSLCIHSSHPVLLTSTPIIACMKSTFCLRTTRELEEKPQVTPQHLFEGSQNYFKETV